MRQAARRTEFERLGALCAGNCHSPCKAGFDLTGRSTLLARGPPSECEPRGIYRLLSQFSFSSATRMNRVASAMSALRPVLAATSSISAQRSQTGRVSSVAGIYWAATCRRALAEPVRELLDRLGGAVACGFSQGPFCADTVGGVVCTVSRSISALKGTAISAE